MCGGGKTVTSERTSEKGRETTSLNRLWKYKQGDVAGAAQPQYNDADWEPIGLPHSFSIPYFLSKDFYVGYGWYRKHLQLEKKRLVEATFSGIRWRFSGSRSLCQWTAGWKPCRWIYRIQYRL